jgi:hypothetical protein
MRITKSDNRQIVPVSKENNRKHYEPKYFGCLGKYRKMNFTNESGKFGLDE